MSLSTQSAVRMRLPDSVGTLPKTLFGIRTNFRAQFDAACDLQWVGRPCISLQSVASIVSTNNCIMSGKAAGITVRAQGTSLRPVRECPMFD